MEKLEKFRNRVKNWQLKGKKNNRIERCRGGPILQEDKFLGKWEDPDLMTEIGSFGSQEKNTYDNRKHF